MCYGVIAVYDMLIDKYISTVYSSDNFFKLIQAINEFVK